MTGGPSPNRSKAMLVPSSEVTVFMSPPSRPESRDIFGHFGQVIAELVPTTVELSDGRVGKPPGIQREVRERNPLVVAAVVEEDGHVLRKGHRKVFTQRVLGLPILRSPVGGRDEEQTGDGLLYPLLGEILQQGRRPERVADEDHLSIQRGELVGYTSSPLFELGRVRIGHLRVLHGEVGTQRLPQAPDQGLILPESFAAG